MKESVAPGPKVCRGLFIGPSRSTLYLSPCYSMDWIPSLPCPLASVGLGEWKAPTGIRGWQESDEEGVFLFLPGLVRVGCLPLGAAGVPVLSSLQPGVVAAAPRCQAQAAAASYTGSPDYPHL